MGFLLFPLPLRLAFSGLRAAGSRASQKIAAWCSLSAKPGLNSWAFCPEAKGLGALMPTLCFC